MGRVRVEPFSRIPLPRHDTNPTRYPKLTPLKPGNALVSWAASYLEEYSAAIVAQTNLEPIIQRAMTWSPPPRCLFKINVDGAIDKANGKAGVVRLSETNWVGWRLQCAKTWMHPWVPLKLNPRLLRQGCCSH